jgi:hypothetical protein
MNLFNAANTGVDPQTGSYLSKKQRVSMFRQAIGLGGSIGDGISSAASVVVKKSMGGVIDKLQIETREAIGEVELKTVENKDRYTALRGQVENVENKIENDGGKGGSLVVQPTSNIVGSDRNISDIQQRTANFQQAIELLTKKVVVNVDNIQNIYDTLHQNNESEITETKNETDSLKREAEDASRSRRENLIEGIGSGIASVQVTLGKAAKNIGGGIKSLLGKIAKALLLFGGAWLVDNYEELAQRFGSIPTSLEELKSAFMSSISNIKGVWIIFDDIIRGVVRGITGVVKTVWNVSAWVAKKSARLVKKIFQVIGDMVGGIVRGGARGADALADGASGASRAAGGATTGGAGKGSRNIFQRGMDFLGSVVGKGKQLFQGGLDNINGLVRGGKDALSSVGNAITNPASEGAKKSWFKSFLTGVLNRANLPLGMINKFMGGIGAILKRTPIGFAIDLAINRGVEGEGWGQSIMSALMSSGSSIVGSIAGAKAGGLIGGTVGLAFGGIGAVPGAAIGSVLGGVIGSLLAGMVGEYGADQIYQRLDPEGYVGKGDKAESDAAMSSPTTSGDSTSIATAPTANVAGLSTPSGMGVPTSSAGSDVVNIDMGTEFIDARTEKTDMANTESKNDLDVNPVPTITTRDPETDIYRALASNVYDLAY